MHQALYVNTGSILTPAVRACKVEGLAIPGGQEDSQRPGMVGISEAMSTEPWRPATTTQQLSGRWGRGQGVELSAH